jgi:antirestriction protein ArdC
MIPLKRLSKSSPQCPTRHRLSTGLKGFYSPITDRITLPPRQLFASAEEYYATALHETVHSTGSQKRLGREGICEAAPFGFAIYSKEELCAEMGAAYLCDEAGISTAVLERIKPPILQAG